MVTVKNVSDHLEPLLSYVDERFLRMNYKIPYQDLQLGEISRNNARNYDRVIGRKLEYGNLHSTFNDLLKEQRELFNAVTEFHIQVGALEQHAVTTVTLKNPTPTLQGTSFNKAPIVITEQVLAGVPHQVQWSPWTVCLLSLMICSWSPVPITQRLNCFLFRSIY